MSTMTTVKLPRNLPIQPAQAVQNGLDTLNNVLGPEWVRDVDLDNLDMASGDYLPAAYDAYANGACGCMLAQLNYDGHGLGTGRPDGEYGSYRRGLDQLFRLMPVTGKEWGEEEFAILHGFLAPDMIDGEFVDSAIVDRYYELLDYHWRRAVKRQLRELKENK